MSSSMNDGNARALNLSAEVSVEARKLNIRHQGAEVVWCESPDLEVAMRAANDRHRSVVPQAAEAYVVVALAIDGMETLHEVVTSDMGQDLTTKLGLIDSAIELLEVTRAGIVAATSAGRPTVAPAAKSKAAS